MQEPIEDSAEYLTRWASDIKAAVSSEELAALIREYRRLARTGDDPSNRKIARRRAEVLGKEL